MEIKSNDHGTWRRIRVCDFMSLFTDNPVQGDTEKPYQYKIDKHIIEKFKIWKHTFMAMLVEKAFKTNGVVQDCGIVMASSNNYRQDQDYVAEFVNDRIIRNEGSTLQKREVAEEFRQWYTGTYGRNIPNIKEVAAYLDKHFSRYDKVAHCWHNMCIRYQHGYAAAARIGGDEEDGITEGAADSSVATEEEYGL
jgi:phage/plasmid-associated DNA primase